jgi:hypothetical protein
MPFRPGHAKVGGRRIGTAAREVRELAREHTPECIETLAAIMRSDDEERSLAACRELLDRAWGKPSQSVEIDATVESRVLQVNLQLLSADEKREWLDSPGLWRIERSGQATPEQQVRIDKLRQKMLTGGSGA